jgi:hypothetical protein
MPMPPPALPSPAIDTTAAKQLSSDALVAAIQEPMQVAAVGGFEWVTSITSGADAAGRVSVPFDGRKPVQYTVTAQRRPAFTFFVSGVISVTNKNSQPVSATAVSAQLPSGYVLANCQGGRFPVVVSAGGLVLCAFNATLTSATSPQGSVSAVATSTFGTSTSAVAAAYSLTPPAASAGACAVVSDSLSSVPDLPRGSVSVSGNQPYSETAKPVCADTSYNFTVSFGPFAEDSCNSMYTVGHLGSGAPGLLAPVA